MFLLLVFLIVCVLYSRTCLSFVVAFIAENRQLFFSFDVLKKFHVKKEKNYEQESMSICRMNNQDDLGLSPRQLTRDSLQCLSSLGSREHNMSTGALLNCNASVAFHGILSHLEILWSLYALAFL